MIAFMHALPFAAARRVSLMIAVLLLLSMSSGKPTPAQLPPSEPQTRPPVFYFDPPALPRSPRYSQAAAVNSGRLVFISGQVAVDPRGQLVGRADFRTQAVQVFVNLRSALRAGGADVSDIISIDTHLLNLADLPTYREVRQAFLLSRKNPPPTSTTLRVVGLVTEGALLDVSAIAVVPDRSEGASPVGAITVVAMLHARVGRANDNPELFVFVRDMEQPGGSEPPLI
ncbi:hypothetical protein BH18ACI4_BH18ACI4_21930 [soil metagenome]